MTEMLPCSGGGQITLRPHALTHDGESVAVCNAERIRVYSASSGEYLYSLKGHQDEVTSVCSHPSLDQKLYSGSRDGTIKLWDLDSGACVHTWEVPGKLAIESMTLVGEIAYISCFWRGREAGRALAFDLIKGEATETRVKLSTPRAMVASPQTKSHHGASDSRELNAVVATHDKHTVLVWDSKSFGSKSPLALHHTKAFTCVAVSPDGSKIAAGDVTGRILIWHDMQEALVLRSMQEEEMRNKESMGDDYEERPWAYVEPPAATVHWHAHPVGCVTFSRDGHYILSGGNEAVLVIWDVQTGSRAYLPRLGGALVGISSCTKDYARYALRQEDNTIRVVNTASMTVESSIHGVKPLPGAEGHSSVLFEGYTGSAVIIGPHAVLQFYDVVRDMHLDRLQLSKRNIVSMTNSHDKGFSIASLEATIQSIVFSKDASVMVTVERKPDASTSPGMFDYVLKFWDRAPDGKKEYGYPYLLNTVTENPHRKSSQKGAVTGLDISSRLRLVASASESGDFALWTQDVSKDTNQFGPSAVWKRIALIPGHRGEPLTAISLSNDGSITAVSGDQNQSGGVSLWDTETCSLLGVLPLAFTSTSHHMGSTKATKDNLFFIKDSPYLVLVCSLGIVVYNVISLDIEWSAEISGIGCVAVDEASPHWAIVLDKASSETSKITNFKKDYESSILLFSGAQKKPEAAWLVRRRRSSAQKAATLNPASQSFLNTDSEIKPYSDHHGSQTEIAFIPKATNAYSHAAACSVPGCSPLMVFTGDREYSVALSPTITKAGLKRITSSATRKEPSATRERRISGFEAMFGNSAHHKPQDHPEPMDIAPSSRHAWKAVLDAPSHALPPMATLCPSFLELLLESAPLKHS